MDSERAKRAQADIEDYEGWMAAGQPAEPYATGGVLGEGVRAISESDHLEPYAWDVTKFGMAKGTMTIDGVPSSAYVRAISFEPGQQWGWPFQPIEDYGPSNP